MPKATSSPASSKPPAKPGKPATPTTKASATSTGPGQLSEKKAKRQRIDWEAVERDYRLGQFSNVELAAKHRTNPATLSRKIKADQALDIDRWQKDLTEVVRQATNARLIAELVKDSQDQGQEAAREGQEKVKTAVQVAAEVNVQIIRQHQRDAGSTRALVMDMLAELTLATHKPSELERLSEIMAEGQDANADDVAEARVAVKDMLDIHKRVASIQKLADTLNKLQPLERKAYGIKDDEDAGDKARRSLPLAFIDAQHDED